MSPRRRSLVLGVLLFAVFATLEGSLETWGSWGSCSKTCGSGSQSRSRACNSTTPLIGGTNCSVTLSETQSCNVQNCSSCSGNVQADIVFVMDASSSVVDVEFEKMKEFVRDQVDVFDIGYNKIRVGMLKFSSSANTEFNLNAFNDKDAMKNRIMNISYTGGTTNTGDALRYMRSTMFTNANGDRNGVYNFGVILTARKSDGPTYTADQAIAAQIANITIFSIGIGSDIVVNELSDMASNPDSDYLFSVASFSSLSGIHTAFQAKACVPTAPVFTNCGGHLSGQGGQIVSPNFPDHYPNNSVCTWTLTGLPGDQIRVAFSHLDLENSSDCHRDSLRFRNGAGGTASLLSRVCSDVLPSDIISTGKVMYVRFVTDFGNTRTGFNFTWTSGCAQTYTAFSASQTLSSLDSRPECTFIIRQLQSDAIRLQFYDFHLGNDNNNCTNNYVEVHDGGREGSTLLYERYCGTINPPWLTSSQNMMWIRYVTDGSDLVAGFRAKYSRTEACTVVLTERNGTFTSPSYPANYRNDMYCTWKITTETDNVIRLTFNNFSLESATTCRYDWVDILDGATLRGRYCGESPGTVTSSSNRVTVTFKTDGSVTTQGFSASYVTYPSSVEDSLATWESWDSCSKSCGSGSQSRSRACNNTASLTGGTNCSVTLSETQSCNVHACSSCSGNVQADIVFVMDASNRYYLEKMKEFVRDQVDAFDIGANKIRVGVLKYSKSTNTEFNLNDMFDKDTMTKRTMNIMYTSTYIYGGSTYTYAGGTDMEPGDALRYMRTTMFTTANGDRQGINNIGVILTARKSNNFTQTADQARAARNANITIFSIGIGSRNSMGELSEMASNPDSDYLFYVSSYSALSGIHTAFQAQVCVPAAPVFNNCGGQLSGQGGQIVSPNFPDHYPNNSVCTWTLTGLPGDQIRVAFSHLDLENSSDCHRDSLRFRNGADGTASLLGRVCSDVLPSDITSKGNVMYVRFVTDLKNTGTGFNFTWTSGCAAMNTYSSGISYSSGTIQTPTVVNISQECTIIIRQNQSDAVRLEFQVFHLGNDTNNCTNNYVEVHDGGREGSPLLGERYCGTINPLLLTSSQNMMWIRSVTDGSDLLAGFSATFRSTKACPTVVLTEQNGTFTSTSYPGYYRYDMDCTWHILVETDYVIRLTFNNFSLGCYSNCRYDWVDILDGATLRGRYSGASAPGALTSSSNRVTVRFVTGTSSYPIKGFSASYITFPSSAGSWGSCSKTCGSGSHSRSRACNSTASLTAGINCTGNWTETQACNVQVCSSCSGNVQAGIVFVMDASGSVGSVNFEKMKEFVRDQVDVFDIGSNKIRVGVLKFSSSANTEFNLNSFYDRDAMKNRIMNISYTGGSTNTGDALSYMRSTMFTATNGDRQGVKKFGVILTDGHSDSSTYTADQSIAAQIANITIFSIGIGSGNVVNELREMASNPDSDYLFSVASFSALSGIHTAFQAKACMPAAPVFTNCGGHLSGQGGQIVSPNFPGQYPNNSVCTWTLTGPPGDNIRVSFSRLDLENSSDCHRDSLRFQNGAGGTASLLSRVCSDVLPSDITSTENVMNVRFVTDLGNSGTGFNITWTSVCTKTYLLWSGAIQTPRVNSSHECTFIIRQPQSYVIYLQFHNFHVGNDTVNCTTNYVEVRDGDDEGSPLLGQRYCRTDNPPLLTSSQNMTWIRYVTDGSDNAAGLNATYWRAEPCPTVVLTERNGTFTSPSYPSNYRDYMYCTWKITAETNNVIRLTFANFSLESHPDCRFDWVDILDGATPLGRYCGNSGPGTVTSSSNRVTVSFKTDYSVTTRGFSASYVTYPSSGYPPECSSTQNNVSFPDSAAVGTCSTVTVQCSTSGPDTTLDVTNSTDGPVRWTISQGNMDTDSSLVFTVCVTDVLYHFIGQYEAILNVSNSTGVTSVMWSMTIDDVNQPPAFLSTNYNIQVSESTTLHATIAQVVLLTSHASENKSRNDVITVWDPDNVTDGFEFRGINVKSVNVTYSNASQVTTTDQSSLPIYLRNDSGPPFSFLTRIPLAAGVQLVFTLQAEDEQGLVGSNTVVTFVVSDVNQAPVCSSDNVNLTIGLTKQVNDSIYTLSCADFDVNSTLSSLTYQEYTTSDSDHFSISHRGEISLEQRLPLNVTTMTYTVYVMDGGGLVANVTLHLDINRNFPPTCPFPSRNHMTLPETANATQCDTLTIACSHRTELDHYGLTFNVAFVYDASLFQVDHQKSVQPPSYFNVTGCPNTDLLGHAGSYNLDFTVSSELGTYSNTLGIVVTDVNQPPQFDQDSYMFNVSEDTSSGATVAHVVVGSSSAVAGRNEIRATDPDKDSRYILDTVRATGSSVFHENGTQVATVQKKNIIYNPNNVDFTVTGALTPEQYYVFLLTATDKSNLSASATVSISIYDVNEPPSCPSYFETRANMTLPIGSSIFNVNCTDNDVKADYRNVSYGDYQTNDFGYFYVSTTGDVTLASDFPTDVSRLQYDVFARDGGGLTTNVTLFVAIKSHFGPECTPSSQIDVSFPEDALSGTCSQTLVTCTDTSGRSLPMTVRVISDATQGEIRVNGSRGVNSSTVDMKACVAPRNSSLMTFGQFEITVEVNNTLNVTQVTFNVTVTDVNQPPFFSQSANLTTVPEFVSGSSTTVAVVRSPSDRPPSNPDVVDIVRDDPDTQENFDIVSIQYALRAEYTNRTTYEGDYNTTGSIIMVGNSVVRNYSLRPDLVYFVDLTVKDGQGLSGNTTLEVKVTDVNEPPSCQLKPNKTLDILESVQTIVASVSCMDSDYNDTYRDLSYFSYQEADHVYFDVETSGDVKLVTSVPRDAIQLVLKAYAIDGGGLEDNTTLTFIIDRNHPPDCLPSYLPPDRVWEYDKCFRVYPNCSDPTTPDGDKRFLNYTFTGSWQNGFRQTVQVNDTYDYAEFCYTLRSDGNFTIHLVSSNGLSNHTWDQDVIVSYKVASPKFTSNRYNAVPVNETAAVGFLVETIQALVDGQSVPLVYSFTGAGMFEQFFTIDSNTGNITVLKDLSPLAETEQKTYVMATDPATNLTHSVPVTVNVNDVNQPPICSPTELDVTVLWNVTITDVITRVNCTDLDARDDFSQLFYNLATPTSNMWRSEQSAVKLVSRARLDPMTSQYIVNVLVNDTTFTATTTVTINIDRTPPKPLPSVSSVTTDTANIAWTLDQLYLPVITNFTIAIRKSSNTKPRIFVVGKNSLFYVITDLTPEQTYRVDVTVNGFAANVTSDEVTFTTQPLPILAQVSAEIKLTNKTWSRDLLDNTSVAFTDLQYKIESDVHNRLGSVLGYVSTKVRSFRAGSVYADIAVTSNQSLSDTGDLKTVLSSLVSNGSVGSLPVNSSYLQFYNGAYYIADTSVDFTSEGKVSNFSPGVHVIVTGYDVTATCSSRTPGVSQPKFDWTLGGQDVTSMQSSGRYNMSFKNYSDTDPYKFVSSVTIKNILTTDSGQLVCNVTAAGNTITKQVVLQVVKRLETILSPSTSIVSRGSDVNLVCERSARYDVPWKATLYSVESAGGQVKVANKNKNDKQANFTIRGVSSKVRYRCNISDIIATAVSNESTIFIKATRNCSKDEDWAETPGGNTMHLRCPQRYADGDQYRTCSTDGQWSEPDTSRCVRQELKDLKTTIDKIANRTTNETTKDVVETLQNTTVDPRLLLGGDVAAAVDILDKVANFTVNTKQAPGEDELKKFVMVADNVLHAPSDVWRNQPRKAFSLVNAVDKMGTAASRTLNSSGSQRPPIISNKIVLQVGRSNRNDIVFPIPSQRDSYPRWVTEANNSAFLSKDAFNESLGEIKYSAVIYGNLSNVFSGQLDQTGASELSIINSPILALSLALDDVTTIQSPVRLTFDHIKENFSNASCRFLDFSASATGIWSTKGCWVTTSNSNMTVCECDHLTNFAVLMSPYRPVKEVADVLNVFSIVGCSISIFCLILTLVIYFILWRYVKSDRSVLLVHLCVVLVLAYVTFLAGVNRVENENVCTVVAGLLHYLWLVVFFLMLCEGIDIFITVVIVFPIKSVVPWLLLMAYGMPVIIVGVSMGVTKSEGYGGKVFCWLSLEEGLFWAFVGPAVAALLTNFVFIVIVIHTLLNSRVMITKDKRERAKSVVKAICVMTPILGLSWIFGVLSVNEETVVFQILFVIFNSLQGLMIFILHCVLSKQVKEGMQHKQRRYQANSKAAEDSSSKYVSQKPTSESSMSSNDLNKKTISPFLQVDQLSQQLASKLNKLDNSNLMSSHVTPKVMALKNPVAGITCTPQAKERSLNIPLNNTIDGQDDQHRRLDHVYGAGTRKSDTKMMGVAYPRSRGGRFSLSAPNIGISPPLGNPVYHDAVPALSPTDRWVRGAKSSRPQQQQRRGQQHPPVRHLPQPAPFEQPHSSFYRLGASADNLGSAHYQHFATQGQVHNRHGNKRQPNQVDAKPSMLYHEPPVDYQ